MIKKLKTLLISSAAIVALGIPLLAPAAVHADDTVGTQVQSGLCSGASLDASTVGQNDTCTIDPAQSTTKVNNTVNFIINVFSFVVGFISVIMIIVGGLMYITSAGDSGKVTNAKNTIMYAIIGLVVVALSQFIVHFVLAKVSQT